ncbi:MAG: hypothetical protein Q8M37_03370, partial [Nevskia sp.]|nr:hypothetical protein [Nevskia sp.]
MSLHEGQQLVDQGRRAFEQGGIALGLSHPMPPPESRTPLKAAFCLSHSRAVAVGLLLAFAVSAPLEAANDTATKLKAGSEDLNRVRAKIGAANQSIDRDRSAQSAQRQAVETAERKIAESQAQLKKLAAQVDEQDARLRAAQAS